MKLVWLTDYQVMVNATPNNWSYSAPIADSRYGMEIQFDQAWKGPIYFRITSVSGVAPSGARPEGIWSRVSEYTVAGAPGPPFLAA